MDSITSAAGQVLGAYAREADSRFAALTSELAAVKTELAALRSRLEEKGQPAALKRIA